MLKTINYAEQNEQISRRRWRTLMYLYPVITEVCKRQPGGNIKLTRPIAQRKRRRSRARAGMLQNHSYERYSDIPETDFDPRIEYNNLY